MTHLALVKMLERYDLSSQNSSFDALREILQEIVLLGLYEAGFFKYAVFYGGTALRILYKLPRFSEDLDFSLLKENENFDFMPYKKVIIETLKSYGFDVDIEIKQKKSQSAISSAFIKGNKIEHFINVNAPKEIYEKIHKEQLVKIKLEVDTKPLLHFQEENIIHLTPRAFLIRTMTPPSLFAGKIHAILCRAWGKRPKGRDWYDLVWYIANDIKLDLNHLKARLEQSCSYLQKQGIDIPTELKLEDVKSLVKKRVESLDAKQAKNDVKPFIKEPKELDLWSKTFFLQIIENIKA